jgi:hypothetical protein
MIQTSWGYTLLDADDMPEILTQEEFNSMTANKYALDSRVLSAIKSVTASIRNYCGWHIAGPQKCELVLNVQNLHITRKYSDMIIQLPYRFVSDVEKVIFNATKEDDEWVGDECEFDFTYNGRLTVYDAEVCSRKSKIVIIATVGLNDTDAIKGLIANKVGHMLSGTFGVQSESAGGLSISYSTSFVNGAKPNSLMTDDKELLNSYKIVELL